jgi:aflatoxin B1 aldehyde reductase
VNADSVHKPSGRWTNTTPLGKFFAMTYLKPELLEAAKRVHTEAQKHAITGHEVALRWVLHHSALEGDLGDGMIIGASSLEQLDANLKMCDAGPLPDDLVKVVEDVWPLAEPVAPWAWMEEPPPELLKMLEDMKKQH